MRAKIQRQLKKQLHWPTEEGVKAKVQQELGPHIHQYFPPWVKVIEGVQKQAGKPVVEEMWAGVRGRLSDALTEREAPKAHMSLPWARFGQPLSRREAKAINFAIAYGGGSFLS